MIFDYSKLNGRIIEKLGARNKFASKMELSEHSISSKLNNKTYWKSNEIQKAINLLDIPIEDVGAYFFKIKVQQNEQKE